MKEKWLHNLSLHFAHGGTYCGVKQWGVGGARAAEEAVLWHQVFICIYTIIQVPPTDQAAVKFGVCWTRQMHAVIALKKKHALVALTNQ